MSLSLTFDDQIPELLTHKNVTCVFKGFYTASIFHGHWAYIQTILPLKTRTIFHRLNASLKTGVGYFKSLSEHFQEDYIWSLYLPLMCPQNFKQPPAYLLSGKRLKEAVVVEASVYQEEESCNKCSDKASFLLLPCNL